METTNWVSKNFQEIKQIANDNSEKLFQYSFVIKFAKEIFFKVYTDSEAVDSYLRKEFETYTESRYDYEFYYLTNNQLYEEARIKIDSKKDGTTCLIDRSNKTALTFGIKSSGLLKSILYGLVSYEHLPLYFPLHASALVVNGIGVVFTGPHGMGKTTTIMNVITYCRKNFPEVKISFIDDDWVLVTKEENQLVMYSFDPKISLRKDLVKSFPELGLDSIFENNIAQLSKMEIPIENIFNDIASVNKNTLNKIFVLKDSKDSIPADWNLLVEEIFSSTSHMPVLEMSHQINDFWLAASKYCNLFFVNSRFDLKESESHYNKLISNILQL